MKSLKGKSKEKNSSSEDKPSFWDWLIHGKGTVAEPWRTAEEVLQDESVQKEIQEIKKIFDKYQAKNKNQLIK